MKLSFRLPLGLMFLSLSVLSVRAVLVFIPITQANLAAAHVNFEIKTDLLKDGDVLFRIQINSTGGNRSNFTDAGLKNLTTLNVMEITGNFAKVSSTITRHLPSEVSDSIVTCVFTVPKAALEDPKLFFVFEQKTVAPPISPILYVVRLKDFYKP